MKWTKLTIETTTEATDMLSYQLAEYGVEGIEIEDKIPLSEEDRRAMYIDILPELPPDDGVAYISCYLDDRYNIKDLCNYIGETLRDLSAYMGVGTGSIRISETEDKDWINNWKEFFHPFRLEDNIVIQPTWTEEANLSEGDMVIRIDPGTSFGTGSHETTRLCIAGLKKYIRPGMRVMDAGCGSGILSIIAMKLSSSFVFGVDIDEVAVDTSRENLILNGISEDQFQIVQGDVAGDPDFAKQSLEQQGCYDIVTANILAEVIIPLSAVIRPFLKDGGVLITSGIIDTKEEAVTQALHQNGFRVLEVRHLGEWVSIVAG